MSDKYQALRDAVKEADDDYGLSLYRDGTAQLVELLAERDALEAELAVSREAIEVCLDVAERLPSDDDGAAAVRSCTLRRLNEAVGKAVPRLMMERPEGQKLYGLNYMEMWGRIKALEDREQALEATLERQQLISYEREREIDQEEIERLIALRRGDAEILERMRAELAEAVTALPQAIRNERERCAKIIEDMVRAVDGADALAAIRGA